MNLDLAKPIVELAGEAAATYARIGLRLTQAFIRGAISVAPRRPTTPRSLNLKHRADIVRLLRLFRSALGPEESKAFVELLNTVSQNSHQIQRALVVWLNLIEVLVQDTESRHGRGEGLGRLKKTEVKNAFRYLVRSGKLNAQNTPPSLHPLIFDVVIDWSIDEIVFMTNRYDLWVVYVEPVNSGQYFRQRIMKAVVRFGSALANSLARTVEWLDNSSSKLVLSPNLETALKAVEQEGLISSQDSFVSGTVQLIIRLGSNRQQIVNASELVFAAVQEAETFVSLTGPGKKAYAREVIWAVLEDAGFAPEPGLLSAILDTFIDLLIETSVHLFNKRGGFRHGGDDGTIYLPGAA